MIILIINYWLHFFFQNLRALNRFLERFFQFASETVNMGGFFHPVFDIFGGSYYLLDYSIREDQKYRVLTASQARASLTLYPRNVLNIQNSHLLNVSRQIRCTFLLAKIIFISGIQNVFVTTQCSKRINEKLHFCLGWNIHNTTRP